MCKQISIALLFLLPLNVVAALHPTAFELLDKYAANQDKLKSFIAKTGVTATHLSPDARAGQASIERYVVEFRYKDWGSDLGIYYNWTELKLGDDGIWVPEDRSTTWLWNGKWGYEYHRASALDSSRVYIFSGADYIKRGIPVLYSGVGPILGLLYRDVDRFDSILRQSDSISVRNKLERVGSVDYYVIDADTEHGAYAVRLDPEHGYGIAKAVVHRGPEDLLHGRPLNSYIGGESSKNQSFFLENVRFEKIEGVWVPMEADSRSVTEPEDTTMSTRAHYKITHIDIDPNHAELQSLVPNIQNGTGVIVKEGPRTEYRWQDGMKFLVDERDGRVHYVPEDWSILVSVGKAIPKFEGIKLKLSAEQTKNRAILLCFFDMNQRSSRHCVTQLTQKAVELKQKGVIVVALQAAPVSETSLGEWTKKYKIPLPVGMITADIERTRFAWGVRSLPWLILTDRNHIVRAEGFGIDELSARLDAVGKQSSAAARIFGTVRDTAGKPLEGAEIRIVPAPSSLCRSNPEGRFQLEYELKKDAGPETDYYLSARHQGRNLAAHLLIDENAGPIDVRLDPAVIITGTVVDTKGRYVANAEVTVWIRGANWKGSIAYDTVRTNSHGQFRLGALPLEINIPDIGVTATGYCQHFVFGRDLSIAAENPVVLKTVTLHPANLSVSGIVVDQNNRPVSGATVKVLGAGEPRNDTLTDADGRFRVDKLGAGGIRVIVRYSNETILEGQIDCRAGESNVKVVLAEIGRAPRPPKSLLNCALPAFDNMGIDFDIGPGKGRSVLACFFDMNQRPSRHCITELAKQAEHLKQKGVSILAVQAAPVDKNTLKEWIAKSNIAFPVGVMTADIDKTRFTWGVRSLPWLILTDRKHIVCAEGFGLNELDDKIRELDRRVDSKQ